MKTYFSTLINSSLLAVGVAIASSAFSPVQAASLTFNLSPFTGNNAQVKVTLNDLFAGSNTVRVTAAVDSSKTGNIADIVGLFFNLKDNSLINQLSIVPVSTNPGATLTVSNTKGFGKLFLDKSGSTTDGRTDLDNNVNLNGGGVQRTFEVGVQIGKGGLKDGQDDYQAVTFDLKATGLDLGDFTDETFGVRLQSVGKAGTSREGSSKLEGKIPPPPPPPPPPQVTEIPEPGTTAAIGLFALSALGFLKKK
ncbi:MAG: hypothetical protein MUD14_23920 [Hydrococcus sp. Prado102]|jgi:hypothetical protein|nr:hypothetical protein [Hydrococcus sp. Prado102]